MVTGGAMRRIVGLVLGAMLAGGCSVSSDDSIDGGTAQVTVGDKTFDVDRVILSYEFGEDGYFRLEANDADHPDQDCLPVLAGGLALYGEMPAGATSLADIADMDLPFEFTGDGDDANLCFVGSNGLLGVEQGTVRFGALEGR